MEEIVIILKALILTLIIECSISAIYCRDKKMTFTVLCCNMITNPTLNAFLILSGRFFSVTMYRLLILTLEILVVISEGELIYRVYGAFSRKKSYALSLILNLSSFSAGLFLTGFHVFRG